MCDDRCAYVARKEEPETWHGEDPDEWFLDRIRVKGGLNVTEWHCPHPTYDESDFCAFHTDPSSIPAEVQTEALHEALGEVGTRPVEGRDEHRGQFVGATFGAVALSGVELSPTGDAGIRFDHSEFRTGVDGLMFDGLVCTARNQSTISFSCCRFASDSGNINFHMASFEAAGAGQIRFHDAELVTEGTGTVAFGETQFRSEQGGMVCFDGTRWRASGDGKVVFVGAQFAGEEGQLRFDDTTFRTDGKGTVAFDRAGFVATDAGAVSFREAAFVARGTGHVDTPRVTFEATRQSDVDFQHTSFVAEGGGDVKFHHATFRSRSEGEVRFHGSVMRADDGTVQLDRTSFEATGPGEVQFTGVTLRADRVRGIAFALTEVTSDANRVRFDGLDLANGRLIAGSLDGGSYGGVDFSGVDLREGSVDGAAVDGSTTCTRLYEAYETDAPPADSSIRATLDRWRSGSTFDSDDWDAVSRAYHSLKTAFSNHGLVGKARWMHYRERRARSLEARAEDGALSSRYLASLPSRIFTGYGVRVRSLAIWMLLLFGVSTVVYQQTGWRSNWLDALAYSTLAFTVAPPEPADGLLATLVMMVETFFGTLSIVLLGYVLGNREDF